jgi:hypothetical protein
VQDVKDEWWDAQRTHNMHKSRNIDLDDECPMCLGKVRSYTIPDAPEDPMSKNRHRTGDTPPTYTPRGNPPEPPPAALATYKREEAVTDSQAVAAFQLVSTVTNLGFTDRALDILEAWVINKRGDANLEAGYNWDGSVIKQPKAPDCPKWSECSRPQQHWGPCTEYIPWNQRNPPQTHTTPAAAAYTSPGRLLRQSDGSALVDGVAHSKECECKMGCEMLRASERAGRHAAANNGVTDRHPNSYTTGEKIDQVTADEVGIYTKYYEVTGSESCGHVWICRLVDRVWCHTCDKRPVNYRFKLVPMAALDPRVTAYRTAKAEEKVRLNLGGTV